MPRKKRVLIIIHLCLAFTYLFWIVLHPILKEVVMKKSEAVLFENVIGNAALFATLEPSVQEEIQGGHERLKQEHHGTYFENFSVSLFGLIWMISSIMLAIFMLFRIEGAAPACWLLPMIVLAYGYFIGTAQPTLRPDFFPSEEQLTPYMAQSDKKPREKLVEAWNAYLIAEKLHETPVEERYEEQIVHGNFLFNVERVRWLSQKKEGDVTMAASLFTPSAFQFILYIIWNFLFAWLMNRRSRSEAVLSVS